MSITYCIQITVKDHLNRENLRLLIERSQKAQCRFYLTQSYEYFELDKNIALDQEKVVNSIMVSYQETEHGGPVIVHKDDMQMLFSFENQKNNLMLELTLFACDWQKEFLNGEYTKDFARYINLLLDITQDFPIIDIAIKYQ